MILIRDPQVGTVTVTLDMGRSVRVRGARLPTVVLTRTAGPDPSGLIPIGTRDRRRLTLTVDGAEARTIPGKGRVLRRTYRVDVRYDGARYRLIPHTSTSSRFLRDGRPLGALKSAGNGPVHAEWAVGTQVTAQDAAIAYTLAAAFGTGGQPWWSTLEELMDEIP